MAAEFIPEPCRVPEDSEVGQDSGKKPGNDGVRKVLHHHNDQKNETGQASTEYPYPAERTGQ
ncbi:hypothetical protein ADH76_16015 [Enterocloster clostridioformis]|nr:hypothetical protein A4V08_09345 [Lachnoclostridium sp. YL32]OXE67512.1 hypothetical protein ADH76_16015 [Enterocloster clostridioformis]